MIKVRIYKWSAVDNDGKAYETADRVLDRELEIEVPGLDEVLGLAKVALKLYEYRGSRGGS